MQFLFCKILHLSVQANQIEFYTYELLKFVFNFFILFYGPCDLSQQFQISNATVSPEPKGPQKDLTKVHILVSNSDRLLSIMNYCSTSQCA